MNVGGARLDRAADDLIDAPNDRRLIGDVAQALQIEIAGVLRAYVGLDEGGAVGAIAIEAGPSLLEQRWRRDAQLEREARGIGERLHRAILQRIGHREGEPLAGRGERKDAVGADEFFGDFRLEHRLAGRLLRGHHGNAQECAEMNAEIVFRDEAELRQHMVEALAALARGPLRALQSQFVDDFLT